MFVHRNMALSIGKAPGWDYDILVQAKLTEYERHAQVWAQLAMADDPARRLAFKVAFRPKNSSHEPVVIYPNAKGKFAVFKANAFVGATDSMVAETPKRYLNIQEVVHDVPEDLQYFIKGGYTNEHTGERLRRFIPTNGRKRIYESEEGEDEEEEK